MPRAEDTPAHGCGRDGLPGDDRSIDRRPQRDGPESQAPGHLVGRGRRTASPPGQDCPLDLSHTPRQGTVCSAPNEDSDDTFPFCAVGFSCPATGARSTGRANLDED